MHLPRRPVWSDDQFTALASTPGPAHPLRTGPRPIGSHAGALVESHCGPRRASLTTNGPDRYDVSTRSALAEVAVAIHCTTARATLTAHRASAGGARGRRRRWPLARGGSTKSHSRLRRLCGHGGRCGVRRLPTLDTTATTVRLSGGQPADIRPHQSPDRGVAPGPSRRMRQGPAQEWTLAPVRTCC